MPPICPYVIAQGPTTTPFRSWLQAAFMRELEEKVREVLAEAQDDDERYLRNNPFVCFIAVSLEFESTVPTLSDVLNPLWQRCVGVTGPFFS